MKKSIIIIAITTCTLIYFSLSIAFVLRGISVLESQSVTEDYEDPSGFSYEELAELSSEESLDFFIVYNGELYTEYYKDDLRLIGLFSPYDELNFKKIKVDCVDADNTEEVVFSTKIRTYKNDPENNFICDCGFLSSGEIYRKVSFEIPDYLSDGTAIKRIALESTMDAYGNDRNDKKYIDDPELIEEFMKTVRKAAANQDPSVIVPVGSYETYWCALEFDGINGALNIGFIRSTADGHYGFSSVERDREYISDPYGFISLPEELQKHFIF